MTFPFNPDTSPPDSQRRRPRRIRRIILMTSTVLLGAAIGIGIMTFVYAKGGSYLSNQPEACANCHVMREVLHDWRVGDHHHVAVCNDCHVPQGVLSKWAIKALNGAHHSYAFTFLETPVNIRAGALSRKIVQDNCLRCHGALLPTHPEATVYGKSGEAYCVKCHRQVGHFH